MDLIVDLAGAVHITRMGGKMSTDQP